MSRALQGSCQVPLAVYARLQAGQVVIDGLVGSPDGARMVRSQRSGAPARALQLAAEVADELLRQGAGEIIAELGHD